jgi:hypothetical protein
MPINKPRNRHLIFRLSDEEYEVLQAASCGSRSLSDFARKKLLASLDSNPIDTQLTELRTTVARLADLVERSSGLEEN